MYRNKTKLDKIKFQYYVPKTYIRCKEGRHVILKKYSWNYKGFFRWLYKYHNLFIDNKKGTNLPNMLFSLNSRDINKYFSLRKRANKLQRNNTIRDNYGAFEWEDFQYDTRKEQIYGLDLMKLKTGNIPAIKKLGNPINLQKIVLNNQEYIAEISMVMFDLECNIAVLQKNTSGLGVNQIQYILDRMYGEWAKSIDKNDNRKFVIKFSLLLDTNKLSHMLKDKKTIYRELHFKCSSRDPIPDIKGAYTHSLGLRKEYQGVSVNVTISMSRSKRQKGLNRSKTNKVLTFIKDMYGKLGPKSPFKGSVKYRLNASAPLENMDILFPTLQSYIMENNEKVIKHGKTKVRGKTAIAFEVIYEDFINENYLEPNDMRSQAIEQSLKK